MIRIILILILLPNILWGQGFQIANWGLPIETQIQHLEELNDYGAKWIRYPIYLTNKTREQYASDLKIYLARARALRVKVVVTLHHANRFGSYEDINYRDFKNDWKFFATELKGYSCYMNLLNEPRRNIGGKKTIDAYNEVARIIRRIDKNRRLVFASNIDHGTQVRNLHKFKFQNINLKKRDMIEVHAYDLGYSWQTNSFKAPPKRQDFINIANKIIDLQNESGYRVYLGEFATGAAHPDCAWFMDTFIRILKKRKIRYTVHAYKESHIWNYQDKCLEAIVSKF